MAATSRIARLHYGYVALAVASLSLLAALGFGRFTYSLILPGMKEGLALNYTQMGILGTANMIGYLIAVPLAGVGASRFGSRLVMTLSLVVTGLALLATGISSAFEWTVLFQTIAGLASAGAIIPSMAAAGVWVAGHKRGLAGGLVSAGIGISFFVTGPVVPALVASSTEMGWRYAWFTIAAIILITGLVVAILMRDHPHDLGLETIGFKPGLSSRDKPASVLSWGLVYRSGAVWHLAVIYCIFGFAYVSYLTFFAAFLREQGGLAEGIIGNMWAISGVGMIVGSLTWGSLSDRLGRERGMAMAFTVLGGSILLSTVSDSLLVHTISAVVFWAAEPGIPIIVAATCADYVGGRLAPAAMGFTTLFMGIGQAAGPVVTGSMADLTSSFYMSFYVAALVAGIGIVSALLLRKPREAF